jgi:hypothetical protein
MKDPRLAAWNALHDGEITVIGREEPDTLIMFVSIPYLRQRISPLGDSFSLRLCGFRSIEFSDFEGKEKTSSLDDIAKNGIEILSTESQAMPVKIATSSGFLTLDFDALEIRLDTGQLVEYEDLYRASEEYWDEWSAKNNKT